MAAHASRAHAAWAASATERNWNCAGALVLNAGAEDQESEAAARGTACHEVSEGCLRDGREAVEYIGRFIQTKQHNIEVDEEMADTAQTYVDYVLDRRAEYQKDCGDEAPLQVEQRFSLASLNPPFEAGGTGDAVVYFPRWKLLEIVDLKGGRGVVVEVKGNKQLRTYGLGALLSNTGLEVDHVRATIVQPRAPHKDGRTRSETFHVIDLMEWTIDLLAAMQRSAQAAADYEKITGGVSRDEWAAAHLSAGPHCKFCKAKPGCPALEKKALDAASVWFDDLEQPHISNTPDALEPAQLSKTLDLLDMIEDWVNAVRAYAHTQAESGIEIPEYILVEKQGREKWTNEEGVRNSLAMLDVDDDVYLNPGKVKTPKQVRAALKKAGRSEIVDALKDMSGTPSAGTNLVRASKSIRPAVAPKPTRFFSVIE